METTQPESYFDLLRSSDGLTWPLPDRFGLLARKSLCAAAMLPVATSAVASSESQTRLAPLQVQGSALEETLPSELSDYGAQMHVVSREELDRTGVSDITQALENVPGVHLSSNFGRGSNAEISIQGSRDGDVLWLLDGVRINSRLFGGAIIDSIGTHMIERIEILKSGEGLFYGTDAVAGVVNIVLRQPQTEPGGTVVGGVGSLGDRRLAADVSNPAPGGRWILFGEQDQSKGYQPYEEEAIQDSARNVKRGFNRRSYGGKYVLDAGEDRAFSALFIRNDHRGDRPQPVDTFDRFNEREQNIIALKWDQQLTDQIGYFVKGYYHDLWSDWTTLSVVPEGEVDAPDRGELVEVSSDQVEWGFDDYGINFVGRFETDNGSQLLGGLDYQRYRGEDFALRIDGKSEEVTAGFVQLRPHLAFSPSTRIALGARYNYADFGGNHSIWNIGVAQPLPYGLQLDGRVGTNFRLPTANELFAIDDCCTLGNPNLEPERSINTNVALSGPFGPNVWWEVGGFYREIENLIAVEDGDRVNTDDVVRVRGLEASVELGGPRGWHLNLAGTYAEARERGSSEQIDDIPEWFVNVGVGWTGEAYGGRLNARHTGDRATTLSDFGRQSFGSFTVLTASAWYHFGGDAENRVTLRVNNLADASYPINAGQANRSDDTPFRHETLGPPRNVQLEYARKF